MNAALEVLAESGPAGLSVSTVAARAGVHETSIYRRWGSRDRLMLDAMIERSAQIIPVPDTGSIRGESGHSRAHVAKPTSPRRATFERRRRQLSERK